MPEPGDVTGPLETSYINSSSDSTGFGFAPASSNTFLAAALI
jgi:hypothetical protein